MGLRSRLSDRRAAQARPKPAALDDAESRLDSIRSEFEGVPMLRKREKRVK